MAFSLQELHEIARVAGVPDPGGLPLSKLVAAMAMEESGGNTHGHGDYTRGHGHPTSFGILQVHEPSWPEIAAETRGLQRNTHLTDYTRAVREIRATRPILEDASRQAVEAGEILRSKGFEVSSADLMLLIDVAWQGPGVVHWAHHTTDGVIDEVREGTAPGRTAKIRAHLAELGVGFGAAGWARVAGILGLTALGAGIAWAVSDHWGSGSGSDS